MDTSIHRTVHCGPSGVLSVEVSLYRTVYCGPNGVLSIEVSLYSAVFSPGHFRVAAATPSFWKA